jgi:hypothetical protein
MFHVHQGCVGGFGLVVPLAGGGFASGILRCGDEFEVLIL